jgi:hypothetical protein
MASCVYNVIKAPIGWLIYCDDLKIGGVYGTKEAALEAASVSAAFSVGEGRGIQINVPALLQECTEAWPAKQKELVKETGAPAVRVAR